MNILVVANNCNDDTHSVLNKYIHHIGEENSIPLEWIDEPIPGKSFALNTGLQAINSGFVAFIDDDHRVESDFFVNVAAALQRYPNANLWCGRILPDWDGWEPAWAHDKGPYAVYPLPVPRQEFGDTSRILSIDSGLPGGGNLIVCRDVFSRVGDFSTKLGPSGHDLGGGEDSEFVTRALQAGEVLQYVPEILQYHYVDVERFTFWYILRKSFQRSRSVTQIKGAQPGVVPKYLWRKLISYLWWVLVSLYWPKSRFYLIRSAATMGEIAGHLIAWRQRHDKWARQ